MKLTLKHFLNFSFWTELFFFALSMLLAIGIALNLLLALPVEQRITVSSGYSAWNFIIMFIIATAILLIILKYFKRPWIIKGLFYLAIFEGLLIFSIAYFGAPNFLLVLIIILIFWLLYKNVLIHDAIIIMSTSAIAVIFGLNIYPSTAVIILILLAVYDFWAVYKTKHMVRMFRGLAEAKVHLALIIPQTFFGLFQKVKNVSPTTEFMFLGTGDIVIPAILVVSALKISILSSFITGLGAILGFILLYAIFVTQEKREPMPGLPPIILGTLFGFLISFLF